MIYLRFLPSYFFVKNGYFEIGLQTTTIKGAQHIALTTMNNTTGDGEIVNKHRVVHVGN